MANWTNKTKNTASWGNESKSSYSNTTSDTTIAGFDTALFGTAQFDIGLSAFTNQTKNTASWTYETKN